MNFRGFWNFIMWAMIAIVVLPTVALFVTWLALPGDAMYQWKLNVEKVGVAAVSSMYPTRTKLDLTLIDRRLNENKLLLDAKSSEGLVELTGQIEKARLYILGSEVPIEVKLASVKVLMGELEQIRAVLENIKRGLVREADNPVLDTGEKPLITFKSRTEGEENGEKTAGVVIAISETQDEIREIEIELKNLELE